MEKFTRWLNSELPGIVKQLENTVQPNNGDHTEDGLDFTGRNDIYEILDDILAVLFPGCFSKRKVTSEEMNFYLSDRLRHISFKLGKHIRDAFTYRCKKKNCEDCNCEERGQQALMKLVEAFPAVRATLFKDVQAAFDGDPAAQFYDEIIMSYPCVEAIATYRIAHMLYELDVPLIPRIMSERAHSHTGIDIHPGASIGPGFFIDHGTGVVIGETTTIGSNVKLYQGVTLGALSPFDSQGNPRKGEKRHPDIEDDAIIYANATILGGHTVIGKGAVIGGNTWITKSVPPGGHVYNKPPGKRGRLVSPAEITLNGKSHPVTPEGLTVHSLLVSHGIDPAHVVVEVNAAIVRKEKFGSHPVRAGDKLEVVRFVGGG